MSSVPARYDFQQGLDSAEENEVFAQSPRTITLCGRARAEQSWLPDAALRCKSCSASSVDSTIFALKDTARGRLETGHRRVVPLIGMFEASDFA